MSVEVERDASGRLRITAPNTMDNYATGGTGEAPTLYTDRAIGFQPETATPDGHVYVFDPGAWACPSRKYTPEQARLHAAALYAAAEEVERNGTG
jgi:hypothetical protein